MSRQVFDLVNQQRVLEGHLEMEWSDGFEKDQAIAVAGNNLLRLMKGEDAFRSQWITKWSWRSEKEFDCK